MARGKGGRAFLLFCPLPIVLRAPSFFFSPASPQHKEDSAEERVPAFIKENNGGAKMTQW